MSLSLSRRCLGITPSATLSIDARAKALRAAGQRVIGFAAGEPDFPTPAYICDAAREALAQGMTRYTPAAGMLSLREAICAKLLRDNGLTYTPEEIIVSNGAKQALFHAFSALLDPGDEVLLPTPCWVSYPEMIRMAGGVPVFVPTREADGFLPDPGALEAMVTLRTKAIVVNSPNDPTGCVYPRPLLEALADLAVRRGLFLVSDEIYERLIYDGQTHVSIASLSEEARAQTIVVNGLSKTFAMTGWRVGYAAAPRPVIRAMTSFQSHASSAPNSIAQYASAVALQNGETHIRAMRDAFDARRRLMVRRIGEIDGLSCTTPQGAFYVMLNCQSLIGRTLGGRTITDTVALCEMLLEHGGIALVPGESFEAPGFCRLSYAVSEADIESGMDTLQAFVGRLRPALERAV